MKNKLLKFLALAFTCLSLSAFAVACGSENLDSSSSPTSTDSSIEESLSSGSSEDSVESADSSSDVPAEPVESGLTFKTLNVNGTNVSGRLSNATEDFSFVREITTNGVSKYVVSADAYGLIPVIAKEIPLALGENVVYIIETIDDEPVNKFMVTLYRRSMFTVSFNTQGGTELVSQQVEEDSLAQQPNQPARVGYTFADWNFDFSKPITKNVTVKPNWTANTDTAYTVEYYWQNIEDDNYPATPHETVKTSGTTGDSVSANIKTYPHFTYKKTSTDNGKIAPDGSTVLKVYYTRNTYTVTFNGNGGTLTDGTESQTVKYGGSVTAPTYEKTGHSFDGFDKTNYTDISESFTVTAQWKINQYTIRFILGNEYPDEVVTQDYNTPLQRPVVKRDGYGLSWTEAVPDRMPAENTSFVADWLPIFTLNGSTITGLTTDGKKLETLEIPAQIDGVSITNIEYLSFDGNNSIKEISICNGITTINSIYVYNCPNLKYLLLPDTLTSVYKLDIGTCPNLQYTDKNNLRYLGNTENPYLYLLDTLSSNITSANIEKDCKIIGGRAFYYSNLLENIEIPDGIISIERYAFDSCTKLTNIELPNSVTTIGEQAFNGCTALASIKMPGVTTIGEWAFYNCSKLSNIEFSKNLTIIPKHAFAHCLSLTDITIGSGVTTIDSDAFFECYKLKNVELPNGLTTIGSSAFSYCSGLITIQIPESVTTIGSSAFSDCTSLKNLKIPSKVTTIDTYTFYRCFELTNIELPNGITSIGSYAFRSCSKLTNIELPNGITSIGSSAFEACSKLTSINIPDSVTTIGKSAFYGCSPLIYIFIPSSVSSIGTDAFKQCNDLTIYCAVDYYWFGGWEGSRPVIWGVKKLGVTDNGLDWILDDSNTVFIIGYTGKEANLTIPATIDNYPVTKIGSSAFKGCSSLVTINIPNSVTYIGSSAFYNCTSLTSIIIPNSVTAINSSTFYGCSSLVTINIPNSVTYIGSSAFYGCSILSSIIIPSSVTAIKASAFESCKTLTIYCGASSKPSGWEARWVYQCPVVWGHTITPCEITSGTSYYSTNTNLNFQFISNSSTVDLGYTDWTAPDIFCDAFKQYILYNNGALPTSAVLQGHKADSLALSGITFNVGDTITIQKGATFIRGSITVVFNVTLTWTYNGGNSFTCTVTP